jgi:hypothetical protein
VSTTTIPAPTFGFLYPSASLPGINRASSQWEALNAFLASSDGALVRRLRELSSGLLFLTTVPGQPYSGAIYFYSTIRRAFFMLDWAGRDDDFEAEEFDVLIEAFSLELALAPGACSATRRHSRRPVRHRQHHRHTANSRRPAVPVVCQTRKSVLRT